MSILTPKMATARVAANHPAALSYFFPCNEGSGNSITDIVSGLVVTDEASIEHTEPHAVTLYATGNIPGGTIPNLPAGKSYILLDVMKAGAAGGSGQVFGLVGDGVGNSSMGHNGANATITKAGGSQTLAAFQTQVNNSVYVRASIFNGVTGLLSAHSGEDGAASGLDNSADASAHLGGLSFSATALFNIGSLLTDADTYAGALYIVDTLPSDAVLWSAMDWAYTNWTNGIKVPPPQFADLT